MTSAEARVDDMHESGCKGEAAYLAASFQRRCDFSVRRCDVAPQNRRHLASMRVPSRLMRPSETYTQRTLRLTAASARLYSPPSCDPRSLLVPCLRARSEEHTLNSSHVK